MKRFAFLRNFKNYNMTGSFKGMPKKQSVSLRLLNVLQSNERIFSYVKKPCSTQREKQLTLKDILSELALELQVNSSHLYLNRNQQRMSNRWRIWIWSKLMGHVINTQTEKTHARARLKFSMKNRSRWFTKVALFSNQKQNQI
jgi:hypothetical protein